MHPIKIFQPSPAELAIVWQDGTESRITTRQLRAKCPCAECSTATGRASGRYIPIYTEAGTTIREINLVGSSKLHITWEDGHAAGFFTYEYFRTIAPPGPEVSE